MATSKPKQRRSTKARASGFAITIRSTSQVRQELDRLTQLGLFGNSRSEVAEELMRAHIRQLHREGWLNDGHSVEPAGTADDGRSDSTLDRDGGDRD